MAQIEYVDKADVKITDIYFDEALALDVSNLLKLDADRLLAGFRETAGYIAGMSEDEVKQFMRGKERYTGQWEDSLIGGHTLGHYMSAVAQGIINPGLSDSEQAKLRGRLEEIVDALAECQEKTVGTSLEGYLFGAELCGNTEHPDFQFDNVEKNQCNIMTQAWVPWYTMHKILAGLVDAYVLTGNEKALDSANLLGTWIARRANSWDKDTHATVLGIEYGGMNDALYELYKVTRAKNREEFLQAAHQFDEISLFEKVKKGDKNCLQNIHANTTIPKFLGAMGRYEVLPEETDYLEYAKVFWDFVTERQSYITGGNSEDEHFRADFFQNSMRDNVNNETCNTYNMLKLSRRLFVATGEKKYADYYENTLINAIMASQNHDNGLTMYYQPMASGYQKVFGTLECSFWCCTGSGMENFTKLQDSIYFTRDAEVIVNLYLASILQGEGYTIEQRGDLSVSDTMQFIVKKETSAPLALRLRVPDWVKEDRPVVSFDGEEYLCRREGGYLIIPAEKVTECTSFTVSLPMEIRAFNLPDSENTYAFRYGPYVLSAKLGTDKQVLVSHGVGVLVPGKKAVPNDTIRITGGVSSVAEFMENINDNLVREEETMSFRLKHTDFDYVFTTHYNQYRESYGIYWTFSMDEDGISSAAVIARKAEERMEECTVDSVLQIARGQYEAGYVEDGDSTANTTDLTRSANPGGTFYYTMKVESGSDNCLLVTRLIEEREKPLKLYVGDIQLEAREENVALSSADEENYYQEVYRIPSGLTEGEEKLTVAFAGTEQECSARICQSLVMMKPFATGNDIAGIFCDQGDVRRQGDDYVLTVSYRDTPALTFELADARGYLTLNNKAVSEQETKKLKPDDEELTIGVYGQDFCLAREYMLRIERNYDGLREGLKECSIRAFSFENTLEGAIPVLQAIKPLETDAVSCKYCEGVVGSAVSMDGSYGLKLLEDASELGDSYTISFWMKPAKMGGSYDPTIMAGGFEEENPHWLNLSFDGKLWSCDRGWVTAEPTNCFEEGRWQQVTIVIDGSRAGTVERTVRGELYLDGKLVIAGNVAEKIMTQGGASVYFGINPWDACFEGELDEVMMFSRALSVQEVKALAEKIVTADMMS